jgi:hypothetical protein
MSPVRTSFESPWQNGVAERWVESCRRDRLDHIIGLNERHLKRLLSEYIRYYPKTARISSWGRERRTVEVVPEPLVASCLMTDSAGCTTATIALPSRDKFSSIPNIHTPHGRTRLRPKEPSRSSKQFLIECRLPVQAVAKKNRAIFGADGLLANHNGPAPVHGRCEPLSIFTT